MDDQLKAFWDGRDWPDDAYGYEFLGRAIHRVGVFLYASDWTGQEAKLANEPAPFPSGTLNTPAQTPGEDFDAMPLRQRMTAHNLLRKHRSEFQRGSVTLDEDLKPVIPPFSLEQWQAAIQAGVEEQNAYFASLERWLRAKNLMKAALREGVVSFALRPVRGGNFMERCDRIWWNIEDVAPRFRLCRMNPFRPLSNGIAGEGFMYIFVKRRDLDSLLNAPSSSARAVPPPSILLPESTDIYEAALPRLEPAARSRASGARLTPTEVQIQEVLAEIAGEGSIPPKAMDRNKAIWRKFEVRGWTPISAKTIERYLTKAAKNSDI